MMRSPATLSFVFSICMAVCAIGFAQTQSTVSEFNNTNKQKAPFKLAQNVNHSSTNFDQQTVDKKPTPPQITKKRRAELMTFVQKHHPEIRPLLNSLQKNRPPQYQAALRTLDREIKTLQALETRSPERYKKSLDQWIVKSKIKLFSAQFAIKKDEVQKAAIKTNIKSLLKRQQVLRIEQLTEDIAQTEKRLERLQTQLANYKFNRKTEIKNHMDVIDKNSLRISTARKKAAESKKKQKPDSKPEQTKPSVDKKANPRSQDDKTVPKIK